MFDMVIYPLGGDLSYIYVHMHFLEVLELTKFQATKEKELEGRDASFLTMPTGGEGRRRT